MAETDNDLHHFLAAGDTRTAARLVARHRRDIINQEQWHRLKRWLSMLPSDSIEKYPELLYFFLHFVLFIGLQPT